MKKMILAIVLIGFSFGASAQHEKSPGRTREPDEVDMKGTNPKKNSYAEDTAILNRANMGDVQRQQVKEVDMKGTNPKKNSYAEDTAILNRANMRRGED